MKSIIAAALLALSGHTYGSGCIGAFPIVSFSQGLDVSLGGTFDGCGQDSGTFRFFSNGTRLESVSVLVDQTQLNWTNTDYSIRSVHFDVTGSRAVGFETIGIDRWQQNIFTGETILMGHESHDLTFIAVSHAPEPETYAMMLVGLGLLGWRRYGRTD